MTKKHARKSRNKEVFVVPAWEGMQYIFPMTVYPSESVVFSLAKIFDQGNGVPLQNIIGPNGCGPFTVGKKCDINSGHWFCATCSELFGNNFQKDTHISEQKWGVVHILIWICFKHGPEVP